MDVAQALFSFIADPNVAYALLILGLISLVFAISVPGTGLAEVATGICLLFAVLGLAQLPVNLAGVILITLGIGLFVADLKFQSGLVALAGALVLGVGSLFLFRSDARAATVSWWLIAISTIGTAALFGLGLNRAMRAMKLPPKLTEARLIGLQGTLKTPLIESNQLTGTAQIGSELWTVKADQPLPAGAQVIVERSDGLVLKVRAQ